MPRPSLVTSSGPSPVRGFIAAIIPSPSLRTPSHRPLRHCLPGGTAFPGSWHAATRVPAVKPVSHNRFYLSPYYPVFGSRMVMIDDPRHRESTCNGLFSRSFGVLTGASPPAAPAARLTGRARAGDGLALGIGARAWARLALAVGTRGRHSRSALAVGTRGRHSRSALAASLDPGVTIDRPACRDIPNDADAFGELVGVADSGGGTGWASARSSRPGVPAAAYSST
jgi:hypothetical protein